MPSHPTLPELLPPKKRKLNSLTRSISPPPLRRHKSPHGLDPESSTPIPAATAQNPTASSSSLSPTHNLNGNLSTDAAPENRLEIISWNVNGIGHLLPEKERKITSFFAKQRKREPSTPSTSDDDQETSSPLRKFLKRHNFPSLLCLQEVHISPTDTTTQEAVLKAANPKPGKEGVKYEVFFALPRDKYNARGLGGKGKVHGVCTLVRADIRKGRMGETKRVEWDLEGRVLVTEILGKEGEGGGKLVVVNGYWPNGTTFPYRHSQTGEVVGTRHDFKRGFHERMLELVKSYEAQCWSVVLIGDMNIAPSPLDGIPGIRLGDEHVINRADFNWKFLDPHNGDGMRGVDSWRWFKGEGRAYTYHGENEEEWGRSCDRVDLGVVSRELVEGGGLVGAGIWESVRERGASDHVPIGVVVDLGRIGVIKVRRKRGSGSHVGGVVEGGE